MVKPAHEITLERCTYVTLVIRLSLDDNGRVLQGELVDTTCSRPAWFAGAAGLHQAVNAWLIQRERVPDGGES